MNKPVKKQGKTVGYCRVSSPKQKNDLERQKENMRIYLLAQGKPFEIISDIGSGINFAAEQLTELANDWLADREDFDEDNEYDENDENNNDESLITKETFAERIWIGEIVIFPNGDYEVYYNDDDMFWGHVIIVGGNIKTGIEDALIAG